MLPPHLLRQQQKTQRRQAILSQGIPPGADELTLREFRQKRDERLRLKTIGRRQEELERIYKKLSTRELLERLKLNRRFDDDGLEIDDDRVINTAEWWALRNVLATRPHVMRKDEAKRHRQKVASRQHGQGKTRNR